MNRTSASANARNRSTKSGFMRRPTRDAPELLAETPGLECALGFRALLPIHALLAIGVGSRCEPSDRHPRPLTRAIRRVGHGRILPTPAASAAPSGGKGKRQAPPTIA